MPPPTDPGYEKQTLKERYIKTSVLEAYIKANLDDFGSAWALENINGYHTLWLKRNLTRDEIREIQRKSYPKHFELDYD